MNQQPSSYPQFNLSNPQKRNAGAGWAWINEGFRYVIHSKFQWLTILLILGSIFALTRYMPGIIQVAIIMIFPFFASGISSGCNDLEKGMQLRSNHLFVGFANPNARNIFRYCLFIFFLFFIAQMLNSMIMMSLGYSPQIIEQALLTVQQSETTGISKLFENDVMKTYMIVSLLTLLPLMAIQFLAPIILTFTQYQATQAMISSLKAVWVNLIPMVMYLILLMIFILIPISIYNFFIELLFGNEKDLNFITSLVILIVFFSILSMVMAVAYSSAYVAFKDIFLQEDDHGTDVHT